MELSYTTVGGLHLPELNIPEETEKPLGRWARARKRYLLEHRRGTFTSLLTSGQLTAHLQEMEETASARIELLTRQMAAAAGVTEELKKTDQLKWVGLMNNIRHSAEETVLNELIYS